MMLNILVLTWFLISYVWWFYDNFREISTNFALRWSTTESVDISWILGKFHGNSREIALIKEWCLLNLSGFHKDDITISSCMHIPYNISYYLLAISIISIFVSSNFIHFSGIDDICNQIIDDRICQRW